MNETNDPTRNARSGARQPLSLKKTETSTVKQSFSHGRSKAVVVEKKRARVAPSGKPELAEAPRPQLPEVKVQPQVSAPATRDTQPQSSRPGVVLRQLTDEEKVARSRALAGARVEELEARKRAEEDAKHRAVEDARLAAERAASEKRKAEEEARKAADEIAKRHAEEEALRRLEKKEAAPVVAGDAHRRKPVNEEEEESVAKKGGKAAPKSTTPARKAPEDRRRGKLTVTRALSGRRRKATLGRRLSPPSAACQQGRPTTAGRSRGPARSDDSRNDLGLRTCQPHGAPFRRRH